MRRVYICVKKKKISSANLLQSVFLACVCQFVCAQMHIYTCTLGMCTRTSTHTVSGKIYILIFFIHRNVIYLWTV